MASIDNGSPITPTRVAHEVSSLLGEVTGAVDTVIAATHPAPESLHRLHRHMRRLRTGLALWEALLPVAERELLHPLDVRIKRLSRLVGRIRDRDITLSLLQRFDRRKADPEDVLPVERYRTRLREDARTGRELLRAFLRSERQARLFDDLAERLRSLPRSGSFSEARRVVQQAEERTLENLRRARRKAMQRPTMERLHRLRIRIRRARQFSDLAVALDPRHHRRFPVVFVRLQKELGDLHDLDMVLVGLEPDVKVTDWARSLRKERRRRRRKILEELERLVQVEKKRARAPPKAA